VDGQTWAPNAEIGYWMVISVFKACYAEDENNIRDHLRPAP
jgi:hypothetical protein